MVQEQILAQYDSCLPRLQQALRLAETSLRGLLESAGIQTHSVSARVKDRESLRRKISRPDKTYASLWDVTDLVGLRVTTYFEDTIERAAELIERHLAVDFHHSVDRLRFRDVRDFGYRSLHYVCAGLDDAELGLPARFRFEIQLRTILQHAWAEIEHDLGYKASDSIPDSIRRRFSRIAGLLEIADEEFASIRCDLKSYEDMVRALGSDPTRSIRLDRVSLDYLARSPEAERVDREIAGILGRPLGASVFHPEYLLRMLKLAGYRQLSELRSDLERDHQAILELIEPYFEFTSRVWKLSANDLDASPRGYCLFFLSHLAVLRSRILDLNKVTKLAQFYRELEYPNDEASARQVASGLVEALRRAGCSALKDEAGA